MSTETERLVRNLEAQTRVTETWWVVTEKGGIPHSFGSSERACRDYQSEHGGELQVTRLWETTIGQVVAIETTPTPAAPSRRAEVNGEGRG